MVVSFGLFMIGPCTVFKMIGTAIDVQDPSKVNPYTVSPKVYTFLPINLFNKLSSANPTNNPLPSLT